MNAGGGGDIASIAAGIFYAADNGADVINASLGALAEQSQILQEAIEYAESKGILFVAAAGNGDENGNGIDLSVPGKDFFPAELPVSNILSVAATNEFNSLTSYSNFGSEQIDVAAPGGSGTEPMWSLATLNAQDLLFNPSAGTSMASPLVAGIAAVVLEQQPGLEPHAMIELLKNAGQDVPALEGKIVSGKLIDVVDAIQLLNPLAM